MAGVILAGSQAGAGKGAIQLSEPTPFYLTISDHRLAPSA